MEGWLAIGESGRGRQVKIGIWIARADPVNRATQNGAARRLMRATSNHWLGLKLVGHRSNRDAIGAEGMIVTADGKQWATVSTAGSYLSSSDKRLHFGLGSNRVVKSVEILWPSGLHQMVDSVKADQMLTIDEPDQPPTGKGTQAEAPKTVPTAR